MKSVYAVLLENYKYNFFTATRKSNIDFTMFTQINQ